MRTIGRRKITVVIGAGATPVSLTNLFVTDFEFHFPAGNVSASGWIGDSTVDATWIPRPKAESVNFVHGTGTMEGGQPVGSINLKNIYVFADPADTCIIEYFEYDQLND